tara:strand:+ start:810 stop:1892 length:1083 start_codon:yes stop_codon:yes gene_type:complete
MVRRYANNNTEIPMSDLIKRCLTTGAAVALTVPLTGCFPQGFNGLPFVNSSLDETSPEGIWMLVTTENTTEPNESDSMNPFVYEAQSREMVAITANEEGVYEVTRCDSSWRNDYVIVPTANGYEATLTEVGSTDETGVTPQTLTDLTVTYSSNFQSLDAVASRVTTPVGESTTLTIEGVKVSDSADFNNSDEVTFGFNLDFINLGTAGVQAEAIAECVSIARGVQTTEQEDDVWEFTQDVYTFFDDQNRQVQYYRFNQNIDNVVTNSLGATISTDATFTLYVNSCTDTEVACNDAAQWIESSSNSIAGVSFDIDYQVVDNTYVINPLALTPWTAFLWPHDGDFMHANVSATIDQYQQFED